MKVCVVAYINVDIYCLMSKLNIKMNHLFKHFEKVEYIQFLSIIKIAIYSFLE